MGNVVSSFASGFGRVIGDLFGSPVDFLSGKSCSSVCGPTWDFICYIENFCIANLLRLALVFALSYIVLLFFYLLYKVGMCQCIGRGICKMIWACFSGCFLACEYCCYFLLYKCLRLERSRKQRRHRRNIQELDDSTEEEKKENDEERSSSYHVHNRPMKSRIRRSQSHDWKNSHLRRSLKPTSHRVQIGINRHSDHLYRRSHSTKHGDDHSTIHDGIRVRRSSRFAHKGARSYKYVKHKKRR
ncbi:hypothetical protein RJ641_031883 [Dillenia turbinata]|uniref:Uncharacterized protein n=1 Tax=Dillenia turbinata TaxID=194707 RepID=A0AAN8VQJ7_9MAGN